MHEDHKPIGGQTVLRPFTEMNLHWFYTSNTQIQSSHKSLLYRVAVVKILTLKTLLSICSDFMTSASCVPDA